MAFIRPRVADLRHRITLQKLTESPSGSDALASSHAAVATVWARIAVPFGGRIVDQVQTVERATHVFTIRYRSDAGSWDRILMGTRRFRVIEVSDPEERHEWLEIQAEEERRDAA